MTGLGPHVAVVVALTSAVGVLLTRIGIGAGLLRQRQARRCPACGRLRSPRGCEHCGY